MDSNQGMIELNRITQEDSNFQIPHVDYQANEKYDLKLMGSVAPSIKTDTFG